MTKTNSPVTWRSLRRSGILALILAAAAAAEPLETILARMDASAKNALAFSANVKSIDYTKAIDLTSRPETGTVKLQRVKSKVIGRMDIEQPAYTWSFGEEMWEKYTPKSNSVASYKIAKVSKSADQYLLVVFGVTGAELRKTYDVKGGPEETLDGVRTTRVDLIPKDKKAREYAAKVELWIPVGQTYAVQLKVTQPNGDYFLRTYSDAKVNPGLPDSAYRFTPPKGTKREVMN